jgi:hypothetical protein
MTFSVRFVILLLCSFFLVTPLSAKQIKIYQSTATAPILENDIAFAKHNAFLQAQQNVVIAAIQDLLEADMFESYQKQIYREQSLKAKKHIVSAKILNEYSEEGRFNIELEAAIQIDTLQNALKQMGLILKDDRWLSVTLLIEDGFDIAIELLNKRLASFHIRIHSVEKVDFTGIPFKERREKAFIGDLFSNYPDKKIIYLLEATRNVPKPATFTSEEEPAADQIEGEDNPESNPLINTVQLRILRKSDLEELNSIRLKLTEEYPPASTQLQESIDSTIPRLISLLTINSIKRGTYESGLAASYSLTVYGLNAPHLRSAFEQQVLRSMRIISSYSLVQLSTDLCRYIIHSGSELTTIIKTLLQPNPYFELRAEEVEFNTVSMSAFYHFTATGSELDTWVPEERTIEAIMNALVDMTKMQEENSDELKLNSYYLPLFIETEPNNSNIQFNAIRPSTYVIGEVSNRGDEDIFELEGIEISEGQLERELFPEKASEIVNGELASPENPMEESELMSVVEKTTEADVQESSPEQETSVSIPDISDQNATIYIDWIQIGKTSLAPQLKLYDDGFNFIKAFHLARAKKRLRVSYTFPGTAPEKIYIRISDRIGFIQGETGGFKRYQYLIRYSWVDENEMEPEHPLEEEIEWPEASNSRLGNERSDDVN